MKQVKLILFVCAFSVLAVWLVPETGVTVRAQEAATVQRVQGTAVAQKTAVVPSTQATAAAQEAAFVEETVLPGSRYSADDEEAFDDYVESVFYDGVNGISDGVNEGISFPASNSSRESLLSAAEQYVYHIVYDAACEIAAGERSSTIIRVSADGLPEASGGDTADAAGPSGAGGQSAPFSLSKVLYALLDDCPYELYWYDKTTATTLAFDTRTREYLIRMPAISSYSTSGITGTYEVNTDLTGAAVKAAENAKKIAAEAYHQDVYHALDYYRSEICDLADYDSQAGEIYGGAWQLIRVFDEDPDTNVVCEGYAKAFKYLCDLWKANNTSSEMECYLVEGAVGSGESHMWNIVRMNNGKNYLADITNCDGGTDKRRYFLMGYSSLTTGSFQGTERTLGYTVEGLDGTSRTYSYERKEGSQTYDVSLSMYSDEELTISGSNYDPDDLTDIFTDVRNSSTYYYVPVYWAASNGIAGSKGNALFGPNDQLTRVEFVTYLWRLAGRPESSEEFSFTDLPEEEEYRKAILWAVAEGITAGTSETTFSPYSYVTREQGVTFLWRYYGRVSAPGENRFTDVKTGAYYEKAVNWGVSNGIISGIGNGKFGIGENITRAQAITFLYRAENNG